MVAEWPGFPRQYPGRQACSLPSPPLCRTKYIPINLFCFEGQWGIFFPCSSESLEAPSPTRPTTPSSARCQGECCYTQNKLPQLLHREQAVLAVTQRTSCLSYYTESKLSQLLHREQAGSAVTQRTCCLSCYTENKLS